MKDKFKGLFAGLLVGTMVTGGTIYAANTKSIQVTFDNLKFMVDGVQKKSSSGQPFFYQGTTYVPLRFAAEATGKDIQYDSKNKTIWIGKKVGSFKYLSEMDYARAEGIATKMDTSGFYQQFFINQWNDTWNNKKGPLKIAGKEYLHGFAADLGRVYSEETAILYYNLDGKYSKLTGFAGIDDVSKNSASTGYLTIYGDDTELYKSKGLIGGDYAEPVDIDLKGVAKLKIEFSIDMNDDNDSAAVDFVEAKIIQ
ncbi:copper amine oxidase-like protein [Paenibacillus sp. BK033]|uniref:NPCBM/NEW2 domain-containing protein n=1 Tax=Paenibacillus sp. BK033 TaxID=2512133 RepID=UPI001050DF5D|nr:NPCBM/NEW2 domain-containing protein [Paenibacillus sp. BK033]TCM89134.1 copper amine oxidase-like protein [Paenibacillus sp. BK033]